MIQYDKDLFLKLWHERNPQHEANLDSGEDMFYGTAFMVLNDYLLHSSKNINRLEFIDHTEEPKGRLLIERPKGVELSFQDDNRTLKIFI